MEEGGPEICRRESEKKGQGDSSIMMTSRGKFVVVGGGR